MDQFVIAFGDSYGEAFAKVMGMWSPDEGQPLPAGALGLPSPPVTEEQQ